MGKQAKANRINYFNVHPHCIFCGGTQPATTKEHCPPKALFQLKQWPEGFEFPACNSCNNGTSDDDILIAWLGRIAPYEDQGDNDGKMNGLTFNLCKQHPDFLPQIFMSPIEARRSARELGLRPPLGTTYQELGIINVPERMHDAVKAFARKLTKAIYWREKNRIFPSDGQIIFNWFTNATVLKSGSIPTFEAFESFMGTSKKVVRAGKDLSGQFSYKYAVHSDGDLAVLQARIGKSFGFVSIVSPASGVLTKIMTKVKQRTGRDVMAFEFV